MQAIEAAVPSLIYPGLHFERHFNARKAEEAGCARVMRNEDFQPSILLKAAGELACNRAIKTHLIYMAEKIKACGGRKKAAEIILGKSLTPEARVL